MIPPFNEHGYLPVETDPDLARLVSAWPMLAAVVKRMILAALDADLNDG